MEPTNINTNTLGRDLVQKKKFYLNKFSQNMIYELYQGTIKGTALTNTYMYIEGRVLLA